MILAGPGQRRLCHFAEALLRLETSQMRSGGIEPPKTPNQSNLNVCSIFTGY